MLLNEMDEALKDLAEMTVEVIADAKKSGKYSRDMVEAVCIVMSMYFGRFCDDK